MDQPPMMQFPTELIQVDRSDRHLQFILPLHGFFELLIDDLHSILFFSESFSEPVFSRFLVLLHFLKRVFKGHFGRLGLFREEHLARGLVHCEYRVAARTLHANRGLFPVHIRTVYYGRAEALIWMTLSRSCCAARSWSPCGFSVM